MLELDPLLLSNPLHTLHTPPLLALTPKIVAVSSLSTTSISRLGISLQHLKSFCLEHKDQLDGLTTAQVRDLIIKPATAHIKGSYADLHPEMFQPANVFVSHAWRSNFEKDVVEGIEAREMEQPKSSTVECDYYWIDIFTVNQHVDPPEMQSSEEEARNFEIFADGFESVLQSIGQAIILLSPWNRPEWIFRIWCLYEFYVMMRYGIPYEFVLPPAQNRSFVETLGMEGNDFLGMVSTLDMGKAEAFSEYDKMQIQRLVHKHLGGYSELSRKSTRM
jgi:hypothetical protein